MEDKYSCCGCGACVASCECNAIRMEKDIEGFLYPIVDFIKCNNCGKCKEVCSFKKDQVQRTVIDETLDESIYVYVGRHVDEIIVNESRSGGIFSALSDMILYEGGYVYGVVENKDLDIVHIGTNSFEERNKMRGSKYVQSEIGKSIYKSIMSNIEQGKKILFTGTSCQIAAMKSFFKGEDEKILYVDIVCHGVVSPLVYGEYIRIVSENYNAKIKYIDFRNKKKYGWKDHVETIYFENDESIDTIAFRNIFYSLYATRPACSKCPYKTQYHPGDITIADCWGIESVCAEYADDKGCSLIFVNSKKGEESFIRIIQSLDVKKVSMCKKLFQTPLYKAYEVNEKKRTEFWRDFFYDSRSIFERYQ